MAPTISVDSTAQDNTHDISLSDGTTTHGYILDSARDCIETSYVPSSIQTSQGRRGYGSFEAPYTSIDQTDWTGGRGQLKYQQTPEGDPSMFYDSYNAWTLTPGLYCPAPLWRFATGMREENVFMPGDKLVAGAETTISDDMDWIKLKGDTHRFLAHKFTTVGAYDVESITLLLRYYNTAGNSPGTLSVAIYEDSSNPTTAVANSTCTLTSTNAAKATPEGSLVGQLVTFVPSTAPSLSATTDYWVVVWCASTDDVGAAEGNYWEVAYGNNGGTSRYSLTNGTDWVVTTMQAYYRITEAVTDAKMHFFEYKRGLYAASEPLDGTAGKVFMNGDRGVSTGTSSATTLQDTTKSWTASEWIGCYVHIWNGTGEGQWRKIKSNTTNTLTVEPAFQITPVAGTADTGSDYIIKGSRKWQNVTPTKYDSVEITKPITSVLVLWGIIYLAQGESTNILRMREYNNSGVWDSFWTSGADGDNCVFDGTNKATYLTKAYDPKHEWFIWRALNDNPGEWSSVTQTSVSKADDVTWGTDLSFATAIPVGTRDFLITNLFVYNSKLWVFKEDSLWFIDYDGEFDRAYPIEIGLSAITSPDSGKAVCAQDLFLYFSWAFSLERFYGSTLDDIGPWKGHGMPAGASGTLMDIVPAIGWIFGAYDGGTDNQSSLLAYQNGWHTLFRAPSYVKSTIADGDFNGDKSNPRIRSLYWQSVYGEDATNFLWYECGGEIMFMQMPLSSLNPTQDPNLLYAPESYVVHSRMDTGYAELEKYWDKARIVSPMLDGEVYIDYDVEPELGSQTYTNAGSYKYTGTGTFLPSYSATIDSGTTTPNSERSRKRDIMVRVRLSVSDLADTTENTIEAVVVDGVARVLPKRQWTVKIPLNENQKTKIDQVDTDSYTRYEQVWTWAGQAQELTFRSVNKYYDANGSGRSVFVEPSSITPIFSEKRWLKTKHYMSFTLREL